ncbi:hypothetical protein RUND412_005822 [Rhizina undulata]
MLSPELLKITNEQFPCREPQIKRLSVLLGDDESPSPPTIVLHGLEATGKTIVLRALLENSKSSFSWIPCHECITVRHLTERIATTVSDALGAMDSTSRCENVNVLAVQLQKILQEIERKHYLVLDRIDRQREAHPTLLASLGRLGEMIPNLTVIFVASAPRPRFLSSAEVPHVHFTPYTKEESIRILSQYVRRIEKLPSINPENETSQGDEEYLEVNAEEELWVWQKFCGTVWDSLAKGAARNIDQFRTAVDKMWLPFVQPIASGEYGTRNYSSLYLLHKDMFRRETNVIDSVLPLTVTKRVAALKNTHDLPYYSKFLLCAAYLASYNPARQDPVFFMKASDIGRKKRRGGQRKPPKNRKIHRRLLGPQAFLLERLMAIFHAILPHKIPASVDLQTQIATLASLRLLVKASVTDSLEASTKWRVNVGWEFIRSMARTLNFEMEDYMTE